MTPEEHAERFSRRAEEYDDDHSEEYRACADLVIEAAAPNRTDTVVDLGTGTGVIALALADDAYAVAGRDVSAGMLEQARRKAQERGVDNVDFGDGSFREPNYDGPADIVTTNFALHHLGDEEKRAAIEAMAGLGESTPARTADVGPRRIVLGDVMFFGGPDPTEPFYDPEVDDPATVGTLVEAFTDAGYSVTAVERVHDQVGVIVAERAVLSGQE